LAVRPTIPNLVNVLEKLGLREHLCLIYDTREEQFAAALPFLKTYLERGEKCLYIVDENTAAAVLDALRKGGTDVDHYLRSGALTIAHSQEAYLNQGRFSPDRMIAFLTQATSDTGAAGLSGVRTLLGEMTWVLGTKNGTDQLIEYECRLNHFIRHHDARLICQYHRTRFSPEFILAVIRTHPLVVYGGIVCKNPYYVPPDEFLKPNLAAREVERLLRNILTWERTQQALRASEDHLRLVIDTIPAMAWSVRPDGTVDFLNQRWMDYTGLSLEQYIEEPTRPIHPEDIPGVLEKWRAAQAVGEPYEVEMRLRRADGEYRWFLVRTMPLRDDRGSIVKWYGTSTDIEDRKRVGEELRASEERWRAVFENSAVGIALTDPQGMYVGSNRAYQEMVGYTDEELREMSYLDITFEEDREINRALARELWEGKRRQFQLEKRYRRKDGTGIWVKTTNSVASDAYGKSRLAWR
jgi:PAS domain S-box-containing protein